MNKKFISIITAIVLCSSMCLFTSADNASAEKLILKIDSTLQSKMEVASSSDNIPILLWFKDIDHNIILNQAISNTNFDLQNAEMGGIYTSEKYATLTSIASGKSTEEIISYLERTKEQRRSEMIKTNDFITENRKLSKLAYQEYTQKIIKETGLDNITFRSQYSPMLITEATVSEINKLAKNEKVEKIYYYEYIEGSDELSNSISTINGDYNRDTIGLTGYGVKIGQIEAGVPMTSHSEFENSNITKLSSNTSEHATLVASIMVGSNGMAPDAHLYSIDKGAFYPKVERLLEFGVQVINMSNGHYVYEYDLYDKWVDFVINNYHVSFVKSAGNSSDGPYITSPGNAYNCITVGGINDNGTATLADNTLYESTSMLSYTSVKPEVYAPACDITGAGYTSSGTSFAAPHVTGLIAQLIESNPNIATNPRLIKALVMVGGHDFHSTTSYNHSTGPFDTYVAGVVNAKNSLISESNGSFAIGSITGDSIYTKNISLPSNWAFVRMSLVWNKQNTSTSSIGSGTVTHQPELADLDIDLYNSSNSLVAGSNTGDCSYEQFHYNSPTSGTHRIEVTRYAATNTTVPFAIAWR